MKMQVLMLAIFLLFFTFLPPVQMRAQEYSGCKPWTEGKTLGWEDFKGTPDPDSRMLSTFAVEVTYTYKPDSNGTFIFDVHCDFKCDESWKRWERVRPYMLEHIQGNFDIAEIYARKLKQEFETYAALPNFTKGKARWIYNRIEEERLAENNLYDMETNLGYYFKDQELWNQKIAGLLGRLKRYASN